MKLTVTTTVLLGALACSNGAYASDWHCMKDGHKLEVEGNSVTDQHMNCDKEGGTWTQGESKSDSASSSSMGGGGGW